jgi:hypothetical protein
MIEESFPDQFEEICPKFGRQYLRFSFSQANPIFVEKVLFFDTNATDRKNQGKTYFGRKNTLVWRILGWGVKN